MIDKYGYDKEKSEELYSRIDRSLQKLEKAQEQKKEKPEPVKKPVSDVLPKYWDLGVKRFSEMGLRERESVFEENPKRYEWLVSELRKANK